MSGNKYILGGVGLEAPRVPLVRVAQVPSPSQANILQSQAVRLWVATNHCGACAQFWICQGSWLCVASWPARLVLNISLIYLIYINKIGQVWPFHNLPQVSIIIACELARLGFGHTIRITCMLQESKGQEHKRKPTMHYLRFSIRSYGSVVSSCTDDVCLVIVFIASFSPLLSLIAKGTTNILAHCHLCEYCWLGDLYKRF